jgi:hypothetical protein
MAQMMSNVRPVNPDRHAARVNLLCAAAPAWGKVRSLETGEVAFAVPSQTVPGKYHLTDGITCDCKGFQYRRTCSHVAAAATMRAAR